MKTTTAWLLAAAVALPVVAFATPPKPIAEQWRGFVLSVPAGVAGGQPLSASIYYNSEIHAAGGTVDILPAGKANEPANIEHFTYTNSFPLFDLKRLPEDAATPGVAIFEKKPLGMTLYVEATAAKTRFVVRANEASAVLALADQPTKDALGVKTLAAMEAAAQRPIADSNNVAMRDPAPPAVTRPATPAPANDEFAAAVNKFFKGNRKLEIKGAFIYAVGKNAESASEPDRTRLLAQRQQLINEAKDAPDSADLTEGANLWLADPAVKTAVDNYILTPNADTAAVLRERSVSDDDVMSSFCPDLPKNIGNLSGNASFRQAQNLATTGDLSAGAAKPEDVKGGSVWDKPQPAVEAKCEQWRKRTNTADARVAPQNGQDAVDANAGGSKPGGAANANLTGGDGTFHPTPDPPPEEAKKTNPLKNQIFAAKAGIWLGLLGFIFGGPAGALLLGAAGAGLGYWMSKYK